MSSTLIVDGRPGRILGLVDDESELWAAIEDAGRFAVLPLRPEHRQLADRFAGLMPAPGGLFANGDWRATAPRAAPPRVRTRGGRPLGGPPPHCPGPPR